MWQMQHTHLLKCQHGGTFPFNLLPAPLGSTASAWSSLIARVSPAACAAVPVAGVAAPAACVAVPAACGAAPAAGVAAMAAGVAAPAAGVAASALAVVLAAPPVFGLDTRCA